MSRSPLLQVKKLPFTLNKLTEPVTFAEVAQSESGFAIGVSGGTALLEIDAKGNLYLKGNASGVLQTVTPLSAAQINNLAATSVQLVPAPGTGFAIYPLSVQLISLPGTQPYAGGISPGPFVLWGTGITPNIGDDPDCANGFYATVPKATQFDVFKKDDQQTLSLGDNQPLSLCCSASPNSAGSIVTSSVHATGTGYAHGDTGQLNDGSAQVYTVTSVNGGGGVTGYTLSAPNIALDGFTVGQVESTQVTTGGGDGNFSINVLSITQGNGKAKVVCSYIVIPTE